MLDIIFIIIGIFLFLFFARICLKHKNPVKAAFLNMFCGVISLALASVIFGFFGISLMINLFTVFISLSLGTPGVLLITLMSVTLNP